jgi:hypothetical protein
VNYDLDRSRCGDVDERKEMLKGTMHPTIGNEPEKMESPAARFGYLESAADRGVLAERTLGDSDIDARDVHHGDSARAEVHVADFTVAHLPDR